MLGDRARAASGHKGPWPKISVWHGSRDATVSPGNSDAIVGQWLDLHGLLARPGRTEKVGRHVRRVWSGPDGTISIEQYVIADMGHGTPISPRQGGEARPHMLDAGIHSTAHIAAFWGIALAETEVRTLAPERPSPLDRSAAEEPAQAFSMPGQRPDVQKVIEDALKSAGLLR